MLQIGYIRQNTVLVKEKLAVKNFKRLKLVDKIISLDEECRSLKTRIEEIQMQINQKSNLVAVLMRDGKKQEAQKLIDEVTLLKVLLKDARPEFERKDAMLTKSLLLLPNLPHVSVPIGRTLEQNEMVREGGQIPLLPTNAVPHWELIKKYDIVDFETGAKLTGSGFPLYKAKGAKLQRALIQYFLDFNTAAGYTEYLPPLLVNKDSAYGTGQLPDKEGQMYYAGKDKFYLIPTSEVPVTNIYRDEIVKEIDLPIKMTAYTPCFRREAGSFGAEVRGLNRLHQFDKVEIVQLVHPDRSYEVLEEMVIHVEKLLQSLGLPYRILRLCGGDMSFASALTYDFEVYSAAQQKWLEVSSVSNFETFQTNRMKIRFKPASSADRDADSKTQLVHSLNGSSLALPRIVACLLENNQTENEIHLPFVLHSYFGDKSIA